MAVGLVGGFTTVGFSLVVFGARLGVDAESIRLLGAIALVCAGLLLLVPKLQRRLAWAASPLASWAGSRQIAISGDGLTAQLLLGALLGLVWSPCVGPTLGAATALAAQGKQLSQVALTMAAFAAGIASVLVLVGFIGRGIFNRLRGHALAAGAKAKVVLGSILLLVGAGIGTGLDRSIEAAFLSAAPEWLIEVSTRL